MISISTILLAFLFVALLLTIHELGHVIAAKIMRLDIQDVGFTTSPFPHFYVKVDWPRNKRKRNIFLLSGFFTILVLTFLVWVFGISYKPLILAIGIQFIIETNPIYSDFVIISMVDKVLLEVRKTRQPFKDVYKKVYVDYMYSKVWYLHFIIWAIVILMIVKILKNI